MGRNRKPSYPEPTDPQDVNKAKALALYVAGQTYAEIARELGVKAQTVSGWLNEAPARAARESTKALALERAEAIADRAMGVLEDIALGLDEDASAADRRAAAVNLLSFVGVIGGQRLEHSGAVQTGELAGKTDAELWTILHPSEPPPDDE